MPLIEAWGYEPRNPSEVMAEYQVKLPSGAWEDGQRAFCEVRLPDNNPDDTRALSLLSKQYLSPSRLRTSARAHKQKLERGSNIDAALKSPPLDDDLYRIGGISNQTRCAAEIAKLTEDVRQRARSLIEDIARRGLKKDNEVVTTFDEYAAYLLVKGIVYGSLEPPE